MADGGDRSWWRRTRFLAGAALSTGGLVGLVFMLLAPTLDGDRVLGMPFGLLAVTLVAPLFVVLVIFWAAERQRRLDHAHGFFED